MGRQKRETGDTKQGHDSHKRGTYYIPVLTVKNGEPPIGFTDRIVYSYLAHKGEYGMTQRQLALDLLLGKNTLPGIRQRLTALALVEVKNEKLFPLEPTGDTAKVFVRLKSTLARWQSNYAHWKLYLPARNSPVRVRHAAVYSMLVSFGGCRSYAGLANSLGLSSGAVSAAAKNLLAMELIEMRDGVMQPVQPAADKLDWFRQLTVQVTTIATPAPVLKVVRAAAPDSPIYRDMRAAGYTDDQLAEVYALAKSGHVGVSEETLTKLFRQAQEKHDRITYGPSSFPLFLSKMRATVKHVEGEHQKSGRYIEDVSDLDFSNLHKKRK